MNTSLKFNMLVLSAIIITLITGCVSIGEYEKLQKELSDKQKRIDTLEVELKKDYKIEIIDSYGEITKEVNLSYQFSIRVNGYEPKTTYAFSLKTLSGTLIRKEILIETNHLGNGGDFIAWNGLDDFDQLTENLKVEIQKGITITVRKIRGISEIGASFPKKRVFTSDNKGIKKNAFIHSRDTNNINLTLVGFSMNSTYRIYVTRKANWYQGRPILDVRNEQYGKVVTIKDDPTTVAIWEGKGTYGWTSDSITTGSFNVVLASGERTISKFDTTTCVVYDHCASLFVIQRFSDKDRVQNLTRHGEQYLPDSQISIGIDPRNPKGKQPIESANAKIYFVHDTSWTDGMDIMEDRIVLANDITLRPGCTNINRHRLPAPAKPGDFDIIVDLNRDRKYTRGIDIIDGIEGPGFRVDTIIPETVINTIWNKLNNLNEQYKYLLQIKFSEDTKIYLYQKARTDTLKFSVFPSVHATYLKNTDYRYDTLNSINKMLNTVATEIVQYLNEYEVEYLIKCVGTESDTLPRIIYHDEAKINYQPLLHPFFKGNELIINPNEEIQTRRSLALLRGYYLYLALLSKGVLADCIGIGSNADHETKIGLEFRVVYRSPSRLGG